jgi:outer membrane protein OmpA-like peptidoglycan-associated protein
MIRSKIFGAFFALWSVTAVAHAADDYDKRWYISPTFGAVISDASDFDTGPMAQISVGRSVTKYQGFEIEAGYSSLNVDHLPALNKYKRAVLGANFLQYLAPEDWTFRPYLLGNVNGHSIDFLGERQGGVGLGAGFGSFVNLAHWLDLRFDARYNIDSIRDRGGVLKKDNFYVWTAGIGARIKFGANPADSDGDGVPNGRDKCPNTPSGVAVNPDGCPPDSDGDGVPDYLDKCPGTPKGITVSANGCPVDSDGDGVPDSLDKCPNTPKGVQVGLDGCPLDSDGDGVADYLDKCPGTPRGTPVNADGCPFTDSDGDGIPDYLDKCPNTPKGQKVGPDGCALDSDGDGIPDDQDECPNTPAGAKVLPNGCALKGDCRRPRPGEQVDEHGCALEHNFILKGVKFEFDSDRLTPAAKEILNQVSETLKAYPEVNVEVQGHTDYIGTDAYNLGLSEKRAIAVKTYLVGHGVEAKRLTPVGYGKTRPIDSNETEIGRENNRRVELKVLE